VAPTNDYAEYKLQKEFSSTKEDLIENIIKQALLYAGDPNRTLSVVACSTKSNQCWSNNGNYNGDESCSNMLIILAFVISLLVVELPVIGFIVLFGEDISNTKWLREKIKNYRYVIVYGSILCIAAILGWVVYWTVIGIVVSTIHTITRVCMVVAILLMIYIFYKIVRILRLACCNWRIGVFSVLSIFYFIGFCIIVGVCLNKVIPTVRSESPDLNMLFIYATLLAAGLYKIISPISSIQKVLKKLKNKIKE